jgi:phage terminase large subunit
MVNLNLPAFMQPYFQPRQFKGLYGGRGSGKSHGFATMLVLRAVQEPGFRAVCIREIQRTIADSSKQILEDKISDLGLEGYFQIVDNEIRGRNGSKIIFRGMQSHNARSIKSLEGMNVAWIEEAETLSEVSLSALIPTIRSPGSEIWASWNPDKNTDAVDRLFRENRDDPDFLVTKVSWRDNPWFPPELRKSLERDRKRDPEKYNHVWEGEYWGASHTQIFKNWTVGERTLPDNAAPLYGIDWGYAADPTGAVQCWLLDEHTLYIDQEVYEHNIPMDQLPATLSAIKRLKDHPAYADSSRPETIDFVRRRGFPKLQAARKGPGSVQDGISQLQGYDIVVHPDCKNLIHELREYSWKKNSDGVIQSEPVDANNHLIDALRYAVRDAQKTLDLQRLMDRNRNRNRQSARAIPGEWKVI